MNCELHISKILERIYALSALAAYQSSEPVPAVLGRDAAAALLLWPATVSATCVWTLCRMSTIFRCRLPTPLRDSARAAVSLSAPGLTQPALFVSLLEQAVAVRTIAVTLPGHVAAAESSGLMSRLRRIPAGTPGSLQQSFYLMWLIWR